MREIKFRAFDKETKSMIMNPLGFPELYPTNELMQYTGLKDKNDREIYEGDILKSYADDIIYHDFIFSILFTRGSFAIKDKGNPLIDSIFDIADSLCKDEVIGNIHQNPELLEV